MGEESVEHLGGTRAALDETPGSDPKHTKIYFNDLTRARFKDLGDKFGLHPTFAHMTSAMYEGHIVDKFPHVYNSYATPARRLEFGPYMFCCLLRTTACWNTGPKAVKLP